MKSLCVVRESSTGGRETARTTTGATAPFAARRGRGSLLAGIVLGALVAAGADAAKPPPVPSGTVYFRYYGYRLNTMDTNGGAKTALPDGVTGEPSVLLHGGHRWFLQLRNIPGESYPGACARPRREVFAQRDDGDETRTRQLTDQATLDAGDSLRWMAGDAKISWVARRWVGGVVVEGGVYTAAVVFDASGDVAGLASQPASPSVTVPLVLYPDGGCGPCICGGPYGDDLGPDVGSHDWAPDGARVVYGRASVSELWIATVAPPGASRLVTTGPAKTPRWSPDGATIVYGQARFEGGIVTIKPTGAGERLIIRPPQKMNAHGASWSPNSTHILYGLSGLVLEDVRLDVYRATADGGGKTNLTSDLDTRSMSGFGASPNAWR